MQEEMKELRILNEKLGKKEKLNELEIKKVRL